MVMTIVIGPVPEQMLTMICPFETVGINPVGMTIFIISASARTAQAKGRLARTRLRSRCTGSAISHDAWFCHARMTVRRFVHRRVTVVG